MAKKKKKRLREKYSAVDVRCKLCSIPQVDHALTHTDKAEGEIFLASGDTAMSEGIFCSEVNYHLEHAALELEKQAIACWILRVSK